MDRSPRYLLDTPSGLRAENPDWMRETRIRRLVRPIAKIVNIFQHEPARDGMFLTRSDGSVVHGAPSMGESYFETNDGRASRQLIAAELAEDRQGDYDV